MKEFIFKILGLESYFIKLVNDAFLEKTKDKYFGAMALDQAVSKFLEELNKEKNENYFIYKRFKDTVRTIIQVQAKKTTRQYIGEMISSEYFIDTIVSKLNNKQLK